MTDSDSERVTDWMRMTESWVWPWFSRSIQTVTQWVRVYEIDTIQWQCCSQHGVHGVSWSFIAQHPGINNEQYITWHLGIIKIINFLSWLWTETVTPSTGVIHVQSSACVSLVSLIYARVIDHMPEDWYHWYHESVICIWANADLSATPKKFAVCHNLHNLLSISWHSSALYFSYVLKWKDSL